MGNDNSEIDITVDYLGGDPDCTTAPVGGKLRARQDGGFIFVGGYMSSALEQRTVTIPLPVEEVRALSFGDSDHVRGLGRMGVGFMVGGAVGGLIGALTGRRNTMIIIACERDGFQFASVFAATAAEARQFVNLVQSARRAAGQPPIPTLEDLKAETPPGDRSSMAEVVALLTAQNALLERITAAVERTQS